MTNKRIIRCIRIDQGLWVETITSAKEDGKYVSHIIESLLKDYLLNRTALIFLDSTLARSAAEASLAIGANHADPQTKS